MRSCKELREAKVVLWMYLTGADLATLGKLGSVLPALETLNLIEILQNAATLVATCRQRRGHQPRTPPSEWLAVTYA